MSFNITVADGYFFRPTKVAFYACKCGTNGGKLDIYWNNDNGKKEIELGLAPERNNNYTAFEKDVLDVASVPGTSSLVIHILSLSTTKALAVGNVSITGEVKSETSGISTVRMVTLGAGKFYNLQGMEVNQPQKGIYIQNGKKIIIR